MVLIITIGTSASLFAPIVVLYDSPVPFIALATMMSIASICTFLLPKECPDQIKEQEQELLDGWHPDASEMMTPVKRRPKSYINRSSQMNHTATKDKRGSFAIYAARDGYVHAVNSSLVHLNHTRDVTNMYKSGGGGHQSSLILAKRYHPNPNDSDDSKYLKN